MALHVVSFNIHRGLSAFRGEEVNQRISEIITNTGADIVLLQELWLPLGSIEYVVANTLKPAWPHQIVNATVLLSGGEQGNGVLSRHEILQWHNEKLDFRKRQSRAFIHADIVISDGDRKETVAVICTHFGLSRRERMEQAFVLSAYIEEKIPKDQPLILGGDFNDWSCEMSRVFHQRLALKEVFHSTYGKHAATYPAIRPLLKLDRIYVRGFAIKNARILKEAGWKASSDHLPLAVDLEFL